MFSILLWSSLQVLWSVVIKYDEEAGFPQASNISLISFFSLGPQLEFISHSSSCYYIIEGELKIKHWLIAVKCFCEQKDLVKCSNLLWKGWFDFFVPLYVLYNIVSCLHETILASCGKSFDVWLRIVFDSIGSPVVALLKA